MSVAYRLKVRLDPMGYIELLLKIIFAIKSLLFRLFIVFAVFTVFQHTLQHNIAVSRIKIN